MSSWSHCRPDQCGRESRSRCERHREWTQAWGVKESWQGSLRERREFRKGSKQIASQNQVWHFLSVTEHCWWKDDPIFTWIIILPMNEYDSVNQKKNLVIQTLKVIT